jgi:hypothetical protein
MATSPVEFLIFYRRLTTSSLRRASMPQRQATTRPFAASSRQSADTGDGSFTKKGSRQDTGPGQDMGASRKHAAEKGNERDPNVQSAETAYGRQYARPSPSSPDNRVMDIRTVNLSMRTGFEVWGERTALAGRAGEHCGGAGGCVQDRPYADSIPARRARTEDTGGTATRQKDEHSSTLKAKKDHPEAPDVVIGMQDERGGKGLHS